MTTLTDRETTAHPANARPPAGVRVRRYALCPCPSSPVSA
jgi:hypothetical protein